MQGLSYLVIDWSIVLNATGSLWVARLHLRKPAGQHHEIVNTMRGLCYNGDKSRIVMDYLISSMQLVHFGLPNCMQGGLQGNTMKELMELGRLTYLNQDQYGSWKVNSYNASSWDPIRIPCQLMNWLPHCPYQMAWPSVSFHELADEFLHRMTSP